MLGNTAHLSQIWVWRSCRLDLSFKPLYCFSMTFWGQFSQGTESPNCDPCSTPEVYKSLERTVLISKYPGNSNLLRIRHRGPGRTWGSVLQEGGRALESCTPGTWSGTLLECVVPQLDICKM